MHAKPLAKADRHRVLAAATGLLAGLLLGLGLAGAAGEPGLGWPWMGGSGGRVAGSDMSLSAVVGQTAAGSAAGAQRLCAGAGCAEGPAAVAPTPSRPPFRNQIHLPRLNQERD